MSKEISREEREQIINDIGINIGLAVMCATFAFLQLLSRSTNNAPAKETKLLTGIVFVIFSVMYAVRAILKGTRKYTDSVRQIDLIITSVVIILTLTALISECSLIK